MSEPTILIPDLAPQQYFTVEQTIKRSRFIATFAHTPSIEDAKAFIDEIRSEHAHATHNCWAFNAGLAGETARVGASDDGEPKGTAGRPMLTALLHADVGEVSVVVTRYFGGILLGTGGLVRAYQGSVQLGLETLPRKAKAPQVSVLVALDNTLSAQFIHLLKRFNGTVVTSDFRFDAAYEVQIPETSFIDFEQQVMMLSSGQALVERIESDAVS